MCELIDIWRVIELLSDKRSDCNFFVDGQTAYEALSDMIKAVKELPRIDLVRCGECRWCDDKGKGRALICTNPYIDMDIHPSYFCPYGERRADDKEIL